MAAPRHRSIAKLNSGLPKHLRLWRDSFRGGRCFGRGLKCRPDGLCHEDFEIDDHGEQIVEGEPLELRHASVIALSFTHSHALVTSYDWSYGIDTGSLNACFRVSRID